MRAFLGLNLELVFLFSGYFDRLRLINFTIVKDERKQEMKKEEREPFNYTLKEKKTHSENRLKAILIRKKHQPGI